MSLGIFFFDDTGGGFAITDNATVSRSFSLTALSGWFRINALTIKFTGLSHSFPGDLDFLFVGPDGTNLEFWSDAGSATPIGSQDFRIEDSAAAMLPSSGGVHTGAYRPADYGTVETSSNWTGVPPGLVIHHPAPNGTATLDASFAGKWLDNTTWTLFVRDDATSDTGSLNHWGLEFGLIGICKPHDFNGTFTSSASDILWQHNDGRAGIWLMNGFAVLNANAVGTNPGPSWQIKGVGDFNNDGRSDILWQNADGTAGIWLMDGMNVLAAGPVGTNPGPSWHIVGSGDYDIDQRSDILWQHDSGQAGVWTMNGLSVLVAGVAGSFNPGSDWHIIG